MRSIRARLLALLVVPLGVSLSLLSLKSYRDARHEVEEVFDAELVQTARLLAGMIDRDMLADSRAALQAALDEAVAQRSAEAQAQRLGHPYESKLAFLVFDAVGNQLLRSASAPDAGGNGRTVDEIAPGAGLGGETMPELVRLAPGFHDLVLHGVEWRVFKLHDPPDDQWVLVGERADVRGELAQDIALQSLLPDLVGLPMIALLIWFAVGWALRPLREMEQMLKSRDPDNLKPLLIAPAPAELAPVVASLNRLLLQVDELLEREKRFLAYAAHELLTPLAVLRIQAHNAAKAPDGADREAALHQLDHSVARATRVVEQLLTLARLEPGSTRMELQPLDLLPLVRAQLAELTPLALERGQELMLEAGPAGDFRAMADPHALAVLLQNLVGNAVQHTPRGGRIRVGMDAGAGAVELRVQDSGPGVPPELRERVFERFYRQGPGQGAGLGLSIAARIAELHRARIGLRDSPLGGLEVFVSFPKAAAAGG
jgi:two-component system sensor histidine kinase QseC